MGNWQKAEGRKKRRGREPFAVSRLAIHDKPPYI
jgi:hypothetical protein